MWLCLIALATIVPSAWLICRWVRNAHAEFLECTDKKNFGPGGTYKGVRYPVCTAWHKKPSDGPYIIEGYYIDSNGYFVSTKRFVPGPHTVLLG